MKRFIESWAMLTVLAVHGCATTPEGALTSAPEPSTTAATAAPSEADAAATEVPVAASDDADSASAALPGYYSADQAVRGERFFDETCLSCHTTSEFRGFSFERAWRGQTVRDLYTSLAYSMPEDNPGGLSAQTYADVIAYILELNDYPSGSVELIPDRNAMRVLPLWPDPPPGR